MYAVPCSMYVNHHVSCTLYGTQCGSWFTVHVIQWQFWWHDVMIIVSMVLNLIVLSGPPAWTGLGGSGSHESHGRQFTSTSPTRHWQAHWGRNTPCKWHPPFAFMLKVFVLTLPSSFQLTGRVSSHICIQVDDLWSQKKCVPSWPCCYCHTTTKLMLPEFSFSWVLSVDIPRLNVLQSTRTWSQSKCSWTQKNLVLQLLYDMHGVIFAFDIIFIWSCLLQSWKTVQRLLARMLCIRAEERISLVLILTDPDVRRLIQYNGQGQWRMCSLPVLMSFFWGVFFEANDHRSARIDLRCRAKLLGEMILAMTQAINIQRCYCDNHPSQKIRVQL